MSKRNVYLVDIGTGTDRNLLPLSIGLITSYCLSQPDLTATYNFDIRFLRKNPDAFVEDLPDPAAVGFACYVWNKRATLQIAQRVKQRHPNVSIVFGGYSIPKEATRIKQFFTENPFVDILVHGEGEITFGELLRTLISGGGLNGVDGISYQDPDSPLGYISTNRRTRIVNLDAMPSPFLDGVFDRLMGDHGDAVTGVLWETNRGCPYSCTFCDWGDANLTKIKSVSMDRLSKEIDWIGRNKIFYIYCTDANFGIFEERDLEIATMLADNSKNYGFPKHLAVNWTKNSHERIVNIADALAGGGITTSVSLALQSSNPATLAAIKRKNIPLKDLKELKKAYHDRQHSTFTELIIGLPNETYSSFAKGLGDVLSPRLDDHVSIYLCHLLENTEMESDEYRQRYKLVTRHCAVGMSRRKYDETTEPEIEEIVVGTSTMPISEWKRVYLLAYAATVFYNHRSVFFVMNYLKREFACNLIDQIEFFIETAENGRLDSPYLTACINHIKKQRQMILDGVSSMMPPDDLDDLMMTPHEAALPILLKNYPDFLKEVGIVIGHYADKNRFTLEDDIVGEVLKYQAARMPAWPNSMAGHQKFRTNAMDYFDRLCSGEETSGLERVHSEIYVRNRVPETLDLESFVASLVRQQHTVDLNQVHTVQKNLESLGK